MKSKIWLWLQADVHHCSKFFQSDARAIETLEIEIPDQLGWSLSIYNLFERLSWQMALFSLWWTTPSTDPLLTNCNIPPSFYQLYTFRASKSVLLALPRLKVLLMYSLWREIQDTCTIFWHYYSKFDFVLLKEPFATLKKSRPVVHACFAVNKFQLTWILPSTKPFIISSIQSWYWATRV